MKKTYLIKARVTFDWEHKNHKFFPGDKATVTYVGAGDSKNLKSYVGQTGTVVARSAWGNSKTNPEYLAREGTHRQWTRYFLKFEDTSVAGFYSEFLKKVD